MDLGLTGKVAIVTGGSRGLGRAICLALAAEGARVVVNYRQRHDEAAATVAAVERLAVSGQGEQPPQPSDAPTDPAPAAPAAPRPRAVALQADVAREDDVRRLFDQAQAALGPIDVVVNNAGVWPQAFVAEMALRQWTEAIDANLTAAMLVCREAVRRWLEDQRAGVIVNVSSQAAFLGSTTGHAHYAAAKAGLIALTVSLAREVAPRGIRVNAVAPGMIATEMSAAAISARADHYLARIPLRRIGDPGEVAAVVAFLASSRASYMTGATVDISGGMLMR